VENLKVCRELRTKEKDWAILGIGLLCLVGAESIIGPAFPELAHSMPLHVKTL